MAERHVALAAALLALAATARATDVPPVTPAERAAAFPDVSGMDMHAHMDDDPLLWSLAADELEWQWGDAGDGLKWDVTGWVGRDERRLWLRDEGRKPEGGSGENRLELFLGRPVAAWWDLLAGARLDTGEGPTRAFAALGVQGTAPQWVHVEATAYLGDAGRAGARLRADYEWVLTSRLFLDARAEAEAWTDDDPDNGLGSGLAEVTTGLRLRWEWRRKFSPYAGVEWSGRLGDTADLARAAGEDVRDTRVVAGLRFWF